MARSHFDFHVIGNRLVYLRDPCTPEAPTNLHMGVDIIPVDGDDLPSHRKRSGFDNLDFDFHLHGFIADGQCVVWRALPDYRIDRIRTGQFTDEGQL